MSRLIKTFQPNESSASRRITYKDFEIPSAVIDSIKIDFIDEAGATYWIVSKNFYDGFGKLIQTKKFDFDNARTIIRNISYNKNSKKDSVCNPYTIFGTSYSYSSPSWSQITTYEYDALGRIIKITHPDGKYSQVKYYANTDTIIDEKGNKTIHIYNAYGAIDTIIDANNNRTCYQYDTLGRLTKVTDAEGRVTKYYYDTLGRLRGVDGPDATSSYYYNGNPVDVLYDEYNDLGNLTLKKDPNGWVRYTYDNINRLTKIELSTDNGSTWADKVRLTYDITTGGPTPYELANPTGRLSKVVTCGIDSITYYYDDRGRLGLKRVNIVGLSGEKSFTYNFNYANQCILIYLSTDDKIKYRYNRLGQIKSVPGLLTTFKYNPAGQIVKLSYDNGVVDTITYDSRLRPILVRAYKTGDILKLGYSYEDNSNIHSITDYLNSRYTQTFTYDALNRLTAVTQLAGIQSFSYDKTGNRTAKNGNSYSYWSNTNRLKTDHRDYEYYYDDNGNIIKRNNSSGSLVDSFAYDWNNRLIYYKKGPETIDYAYNSSGLRVKKHYHKLTPGTGITSRTLFTDAANDLGFKSSGPDTVYNKGLDIEKVYIKNTARYYIFTVVNRYIFAQVSRLKLFITLDLDTIPNSGRITLPEDMKTKVPKNAAWEYCLYIDDGEYGFYRADGTKTVMPSGMTVERIIGPDGSIQIKISKQLLNHYGPLRWTISTFDPGLPVNVDTLHQGGSNAVDVFPGTNKTFGGEINGYGEITTSGINTTTDYTIYYVYDGINPLIEYSPDGSILARYVYAGGLHIARIDGADTTFYHCDVLGSSRKMTDESGSVVWTAYYYPFGEITKSGTADNTHTFTGKEFDENNLNYFCQRYYEAEIGRFLSLDPFGGYIEVPQSQNRYAYCVNNPLRFTDPLGLQVPLFMSPNDYYEFIGHESGLNLFFENSEANIETKIKVFYNTTKNLGSQALETVKGSQLEIELINLGVMLEAYPHPITHYVGIILQLSGYIILGENFIESLEQIIPKSSFYPNEPNLPQPEKHKERQPAFENIHHPKNIVYPPRGYNKLPIEELDEMWNDDYYKNMFPPAWWRKPSEPTKKEEKEILPIPRGLS